MKKTLAFVLTAVMSLSLLAGCGSKTTAPDNTNNDQPQQQTEEKLSGSVSTNGSTSMEKVIGALSEQFMSDNSGVSVTYDPTGSGAGIEAASNGSADIGLASRALKDEEKAGGLTETVVALDGIAVIVNAGSKVEDLSVEQIAKIFTGEITDWSEVGGEAGKISCIGREAGSGTRDGFESITGTKDACKLDQELTSTGGVIEAVAGNANAIGYASLSAVEGKDTVKAVTVGGVACTEETVLDGSYAIQRPFVLVTKTDAPLSTAAQAFFDYATSTAANDTSRPPARCRSQSKHHGGCIHLSGGRGRKALRRPAASQRRAQDAGEPHPPHFPALRRGRRSVRAAHQHLPDPLGHSRHPRDRTRKIPLRQGLGPDKHHHGRTVRHPRLHSYEHLRHGGRYPHRRAGGTSDRRVPRPRRSAKACGGHPHGGAAARGHPLGGLRSGRHDRARPRHPADL